MLYKNGRVLQKPCIQGRASFIQGELHCDDRSRDLSCIQKGGTVFPKGSGSKSLAPGIALPAHSGFPGTRNVAPCAINRPSSLERAFLVTNSQPPIRFILPNLVVALSANAIDCHLQHLAEVKGCASDLLAFWLPVARLVLDSLDIC